MQIAHQSYKSVEEPWRTTRKVNWANRCALTASKSKQTKEERNAEGNGHRSELYRTTVYFAGALRAKATKQNSGNKEHRLETLYHRQTGSRHISSSRLFLPESKSLAR